ncbi:emopamil-binding family protein [Sinimarinibacterium sp. NLF-5-8]|uniref:emopamil-binding family protein n=1 Tax=Sinimarinibacterium sp. NLF-5-8 TaxID=2698684 RepID=UPI00137BB637|nr:emopamil-binding family protein [Sinimarinibacterium sp. NLF-5-8]QHS10070.1 hypothetical protein GT972_07875 [Sinimarinibacterium sp. NLF-5-8]
MNTATLTSRPAPIPWLPFIRSEVSLLISCFAFVVIAVGQIGAIGVHFFGFDRVTMAYANFWAFDFTLIGMLIVPWLPLPSLHNHTRAQRLDLMVQVWVCTYVAIVFTWEIPWLLLYKHIAVAHDQFWAYQFWAYIDGGDIRYKDPDAQVLFAEFWTCLNGVGALFAIRAWFKSNKTSAAAVFYLMLAAVGHITTSAQYFLTETLTGFPNVDVTVASNFWAKFVFSNCSWMIMPFIVIVWGMGTIKRIYSQNPAR